MRIAYFLRSLDLLFVKENENELFAILPENSDEEDIARKELNLKNLITVRLKKGVNFSELSCEEIIKYSNVSKKIKDSKIDCLLIRNSSPYLRNWSIKNKIILLSPPYQLQKKFENKVYFEKFLKKTRLNHIKSEILNSEKDTLPFPKTVIQIPDSTGGEGTFIVDKKESFKKIIGKLKLPVLIREYKEGLPLGSSILVKKNKIYLTSIERQCYLDAKKKNGLGEFIGIQWLPYTFFTEKIYKNIENSLLKIGSQLAKFNLLGLINVDFILDNDGNVNFLECNPRITCATNQIMAIDKIRNNKNFLKLLLNHYIKKFNGEYQEPKKHLAKNLFCGTQMYVCLLKSAKFPVKIKELKPSGFYILKDKRLEKINLNNRFDFLKLKNGVFYYNEVNKGEIYKDNIQTGTVISNFALYDFKTGSLNKEGKIVYNFFHENPRF